MLRDVTNHGATPSQKLSALQALAAHASPSPHRGERFAPSARSLSSSVHLGVDVVGEAAQISRIVDVKNCNDITVSDFFCFLDALSMLPNTAERFVDRNGVKHIVEQLMAAFCEERRRASFGDSRRASLSREEFADFLVENLSATTILLRQKLAEAEQHTLAVMELSEAEQALSTLTDEIESEAAGLRRYDQLIGQCRRALDDRDGLAAPLHSVVEEKLGQLASMELQLQLASERLQHDLDEEEITCDLVEVRRRETDEWQTRLTQWSNEKQSVRDEMERNDVEEAVLLKRLAEVHQRRDSLKEQSAALDKGLEECRVSLSHASASLDDAVSILAEVKLAVETSCRRVDEIKVQAASVSGAIHAVQSELSVDDQARAAVRSRLELLILDRKTLESKLDGDKMECSRLRAAVLQHKSRLGLLASCENGGRQSDSWSSETSAASSVLRAEESLKIFIDELRAANERRRLKARAMQQLEV